MPLNQYVLNGPSTVIEDDDRDPHVSWRNHIQRAGRGGVDLVAKVGTPIYAPTDGVLDWRKNDGGAGNSCRFWHDHNAGWADVFSHLSGYIGRDVQHFRRGELIVISGNSGGVVEHLHRHLLDPASVRRNPWDFFTPTLPTSNIMPLGIKETDMQYFQAISTSTDGRIGQGYIYVQGADGPLRAVDNAEGSAILASGAFVAQWHGDDIRSLATRVGIREYEAQVPNLKMVNGTPLLGPGKLTGRIVYDNNVPPLYPLVHAVDTAGK
jgi:Peptidase family M23